MGINPVWMDGVMKGLREKGNEGMRVALAYRLEKELQNKTLEHVLADHISLSTVAERTAAAADIQQGIWDGYSSKNILLTDEQAKNRLNHALDGRSTEEKGKWLVNFLNAADSTGVQGFREDPRWEHLRDVETFQQQDISDLLELTTLVIDDGAEFIARQEFSVMEKGLGNISRNIVELQMNSGAQYAEAYAAAMYIISKQTGGDQTQTPYQMGTLAVASVEGSRILAQYHYGKIKLEEAMPALKAVARTFLVNSVALAIRMGYAYITYHVVISVAAPLLMGHIALLCVLALGLTAAVFFGHSQNQVVKNVTSIWNGVKSILRQTVEFFEGFVKPHDNQPVNTVALPTAQVVSVDEVKVNPIRV